LQARIARAVDGSHAPLPQERLDLVMFQSLPDHTAILTQNRRPAPLSLFSVFENSAPLRPENI
jgi:hypothetical protein